MARGENSGSDAARQVHRDRFQSGSYAGDAYDAYRDGMLTHGPDVDRPRPAWFQRANAERIAQGIAGKKTKNALWPAAAQEHGPPRP